MYCFVRLAALHNQTLEFDVCDAEFEHRNTIALFESLHTRYYLQ